MDFGSRVRELRIAKKFTQRQLADQLKIDFTYLSKIENGKLDHMPSEEVIKKLAQSLDANLEDLLDLASRGGKIDPDALKETIDKNPDVGILLRRLQGRKVTSEQLKRMMDALEDE